MTTASISLGETQSEPARALRIIEGMPGFAWAADAAGMFTYISPNAQAFLGGAREGLNTAESEDEFGWSRVVHPDDYDRVATRWRHCLETGDHYDIEHRLRGADGVYRWFRNSGRPSRDSQGRITQWYGTTLEIEDQKQTEAALRNRERELSQLIDMVPSHLWRLTPDGKPTFFNKRMVDFTGLDVEGTAKPGMTRLAAMIEATIHSDDAAEFSEALNRCLATGERFSMRYRLRRADGVYRWMSSRAEPMRDQDGHIIQWYGLCHDIDNQMRAEEVLQRSERQLQQLIDAVPALIWTTSPEGRPAYVNKRFTDVIGATLQDITRPDGSPSLSVIHPSDVGAARKSFSHSLATGEAYVQRYRQLRADGSYRWTETRAEPLRDTDGAILQWYGVSVDIHELVLAQEALRDGTRQLQMMIDAVPVNILSFAPSGKITSASKRYIEQVGSPPAHVEDFEALARHLAHPEDFPAMFQRALDGFASGRPFVNRFRRLDKHGVYPWIEARAQPLRDADGEIVQWYIASIEIDDELRAQEALRQASDKLAQASQAASLAELSASIAHEVNQPLAAIVANSYACQRWLTAESPNLERAQKTVERIIRDANSAAQVVSRIRGLFKQSTKTRNCIKLGSVIAEACDLLAPEAALRRVRLEVDIENDPLLVAFDRVQVQQVLANLIRNGMEAMDSVTGNRVLRLRVHEVGDAVQTEIRDCGAGIEFPEKIFEAFFTTKEHGMGMGLAISRSIVESHGGHLWAERNEPHGATFIFTLPREGTSPS